jgi:beta-carotene hydroxylase
MGRRKECLVSLLKVRADLTPVVFVLCLFCAQLWACTLPPIWSPLAALISLFFSGSVIAFQHHHNHCPVFHSRRLNGAIDLIMGFQSGITAYAWVLHHNIGHHGNFLEQHPGSGRRPVDASAWTRKDGSCMRRWEYVWVNRLRMHAECMQVAVKAKKIGRLYQNYRIASWLITAGLVAVFGWSAVVLFVVLPQIMVLLTIEATYDHHAGLYTDDEMEASRNITSSFYNMVRFNLGYHTVHHLKPGVHWSRLPALHEELAPQIPPELIDGDDGFLSSVLKGVFRSKPSSHA